MTTNTTFHPKRSLLSLTLLLVGMISVAFLAATPESQAKPTTHTYHERCDLLAEIQFYGSKVYKNNLSIHDFGGRVPGTKYLSKNLGFAKGPQGLQAWLSATKQMILHNGHNGAYWSSAKNVLVGNYLANPNQPYSFLSPNQVLAFDYQTDAKSRLTNNTYRWLAKNINGNAKRPSQAIKWEKTAC